MCGGQVHAYRAGGKNVVEAGGGERHEGEDYQLHEERLGSTREHGVHALAGKFGNLPLRDEDDGDGDERVKN